MNHKVDDVITIRKDLKVGDGWEYARAVFDMLKHAGKKAKILAICDDDNYQLDIDDDDDDSDWSWLQLSSIGSLEPLHLYPLINA